MKPSFASIRETRSPSPRSEQGSDYSSIPEEVEEEGGLSSIASGCPITPNTLDCTEELGNQSITVSRDLPLPSGEYSQRLLYNIPQSLSNLYLDETTTVRVIIPQSLSNLYLGDKSKLYVFVIYRSNTENSLSPLNCTVIPACTPLPLPR